MNNDDIFNMDDLLKIFNKPYYIDDDGGGSMSKSCVDPQFEKINNFRCSINEAVENFIDKNNNFDFEEKDLIIKKINGKYQIIIDNKREEKIKQIFK